MSSFLKKIWRRRWCHVFRIVWILALLQILIVFFFFRKQEHTDMDHVASLVSKVSSRWNTPAALTDRERKPLPNGKPEVKRRMEARLQRIEEYCATTSHFWEDPLKNRFVEISPENRFLHCPVAKAASTFWSRFLKTLTIGSTMKSPYSFPLLSEKDLNADRLHSIQDSSKRAEFVKSAFRNVFVRDPFSRMFSAYVDKAFAPNPTYWKLWGRNAIKNFRENPDPVALRCGSDVTFAEVMSYANMKLRMDDIHFLPVSSVCQPCTLRYDFVGKMETFQEDVVYLAQGLNLSIVPYFQSRQFLFDYAKDAIEDSIRSPFSWLPGIVRCMSKQEMGMRIWRKLQIRGVISRRIAFPYYPETFDDVTSQQFIEIALDAHNRSTNREELRQQKRNAFLEAYRGVGMKGLTRLIGAFKADFELFGYDDYPARVYDIEENITLGAFDWAREWM